MLQRVKSGEGAASMHEFCSFLGEDAARFTLKLWRLLIAESELSVLRAKHNIPL